MGEDRPLGDPAKEFWTVADVAAFLGVSADTVRVYRSRRRGELPQEDDRFGQSPVWRPLTILNHKRPGQGARTDLQAQPADAAEPERVAVRVLLTFGDTAEIITPDHDHRAPLRMPAEVVASDAGLPANELPGRFFTAVRTGEDYRDFRLLNDPRL